MTEVLFAKKSDLDAETAELDAHKADTTNPHSVTKTQVSLGNVLNVAQVENAGGSPAILSDVFGSRPAAGTSGRIFVATDTRAVYRDTGSVWEEIARDPANIGAGDLGFDTATQAELDTHTSDTANPHSVVASQVNITDAGGNFTATEVEAALAEEADARQAHEADVANPHSVTASQVSALAIASNLSDVADAATAFGNIKQAATTSTSGVVEKSTSGENVAGTATDVFPDVAGTKEMIDTHAASVSAADQTAMEAASATDVYVSPGRQHFHPATPKCALQVSSLSGSPVPAASFNQLGSISVTRNATGDYTISWTNALSSLKVAPNVIDSASSVVARVISFHSDTTTSARVVVNTSAGSAVDPGLITLIFYGDLA